MFAVDAVDAGIAVVAGKLGCAVLGESGGVDSGDNENRNAVGDGGDLLDEMFQQ